MLTFVVVLLGLCAVVLGGVTLLARVGESYLDDDAPDSDDYDDEGWPKPGSAW